MHIKCTRSWKKKRETLWKEYLKNKNEEPAEMEEIVDRIEEDKRKLMEIKEIDLEINCYARVIVDYIFKEEKNE